LTKSLGGIINQSRFLKSIPMFSANIFFKTMYQFHENKHHKELIEFYIPILYYRLCPLLFTIFFILLVYSANIVAVFKELYTCLTGQPKNMFSSNNIRL